MGIRTPNLDPAVVIDEVIGNRGGSTVRVPFAAVQETLRADGQQSYPTLAAAIANSTALESFPPGAMIWAGPSPLTRAAGATEVVGLPGWKRRTRPIAKLDVGQSNKARRVPFVWDPPPNLYFWSYAGSSYSDALATTFVGTFQTGDALGTFMCQAMAEGAALAYEYPDRNVFVVNISKGGVEIDQYLDGAAHPQMMTAVRANMTAALAEIGAIEGLPPEEIYLDYVSAWIGESDMASAETAFVAKTETVIGQIRAEAWCPWQTQFMFAGYSKWGANWSPFNVYLQRLVAAEPSTRSWLDVSVFPQTFWDPVDGYVHMNAQGYLEAGWQGCEVLVRGVGQGFLPNVTYGLAAGNWAFGDIPSPNQVIRVFRDHVGATNLAIVNPQASGGASSGFEAVGAGGAALTTRVINGGSPRAELRSTVAGPLKLQATQPGAYITTEVAGTEVQRATATMITAAVPVEAPGIKPKSYALAVGQAVLIAPSNNADMIWFRIGSNTGLKTNRPIGEFRARCGASPLIENLTVDPAVADFVTGTILTGATGASGKVTVSAHANGLYIENRLGATVRITLMELG